ncbi:MAG: hypothetical protein HYX76_10820 [Acidobacteria bacterium]|nr:hypothetical protein [Acidobacteriota bacterium]
MLVPLSRRAGIVVAGFVVYALICIPTVGPNWDDPFDKRRVELYAQYVQSFDPTILKTLDVERYYGVAYDVPHAIGQWALGRMHVTDDWVMTRRAYNSLTALALLFVTMQMAARIGGREWDWVGGAALVAMPAYLGQAIMNHKDVPLALGVAVLAWVTLSRLRVGYFNQQAERAFLGDALTVGLALSICTLPRGVPGLLGIVAVVPALALSRPTPIAIARLVLFVMIAMSVAIAAIVLLNPFYWSPAMFARLAQAVIIFSQYPNEMTLLYGCRSIQSVDVPWHYIPWSLAITTPAPLLAAIAAGGAVIAWRGLRGTISFEEAVVGSWLVAPPLYLMATAAALFDGVRHVIFMMPAMALLALIGLRAAVRRLATVWAGAERYGSAVVLACLLPGFVASARLHPYEYVYFNSLTGGLRGAANCYEKDYWALSFREAARWIGRHRPEGAKVFTAGPALALFYDLPATARYERVEHADEADVIVALNRFDVLGNPDISRKPEVFRVEREGVTLTSVRCVRCAARQ